MPTPPRVPSIASPLDLRAASQQLVERFQMDAVQRRRQAEVLKYVVQASKPGELILSSPDSSVISRMKEVLHRRLLGAIERLNYGSYFSLESLEELIDLIVQYGPLAGLVADTELTEIMVNSKDDVYVELRGQVHETGLRFARDQDVTFVMENILRPLGRTLNARTPIADGRLPDGSRVNCIVPPAAVQGPMLTIRKFSVDIITIQDLIERGTLSEQMARFLQFSVQHKRNILVAGGTSSGKTTMLNVLATFIGEHERIITIEDAAELKLPHKHLGRLETQPPTLSGEGAISTRQLFRNTLRMRPDRIIVGEVRGDEVMDMLQAMNTGHSGSMTTLHANSPRDTLGRMEMLVTMANPNLQTGTVRQLIASSIHLIIQLQRFPDGSRRVASIAEVTGIEGPVVSMSSLFEFQQHGVSKDGKVIGDFISRGFRPRYFDEVSRMGISIPPGLI